jgi:hypothetical protein
MLSCVSRSFAPFVFQTALDEQRYIFAPLLNAQSPEVQEAFHFLLATAMHEAGNFELLNLAGCFPAKRTLLVMAISRCQKTSHQFGSRNTRKATKGAKCFRGLCFWRWV